MMFRSVLLAIITATTQLSIVDGFATTSASIMRSIHTISQSLLIADASRQPILEKAITDSDAVVSPPIRHPALFAAVLASMVVFAPLHNAWADGQTKDFKFPPIDYADVNRCVLKGGSSMGQANAARDKLYDLRQCQLSGVDATGYDLSGVST